MTNTAHSDSPAILFDYERDGRTTVTVQGREIEYQGVFDREKVVAAVRRLGLRLKDRASLYLDAADRCQDDDAVAVLMELAQSHAERAGRIDEVRQRFGVPLAPIGDANIYANSPCARGQNEGLAVMPPSTVETFVPRLHMPVTKEMREHLVRALEGTFVPYNRGEMALRALGLVPGEMNCYVDWLAGLGQLAAMTLFLLGRASFVLDDDEVVNGCILPQGSYGNNIPIVATRGCGERHWQTVATLFRDSYGRPINSASLRTVGARVARSEGREFKNIIYLFRPFIFDTDGRPRPNNLFASGGGMAGSDGVVGGSVSLCGG